LGAGGFPVFGLPAVAHFERRRELDVYLYPVSNDVYGVDFGGSGPQTTANGFNSMTMQSPQE
jgi:hypothetical protein